MSLESRDKKVRFPRIGAGRATLLAVLLSALPLGEAQPQPTDLVVEEGRIIPWEPGLPGLHWNRPELEERVLRAPRTWKDLRDHGVVRQGYDYSCGSAALATLLAGVQPDISEREILLEVLDGLSHDEKRQTMEQGLSLLNLKTVAERRGLRAAGYRVDAEFLLKITRPVIVFIRPNGYRHFAVMKGVRGDRIFLADPARGNIRVPAYAFLDMWLQEDGKGVLFVVGAESPPLLTLAPDAPSQPELMALRQLINTGPANGLPAYAR